MKVLVVGLGSIGQRHVRNLRTLLGDEVEILGCRGRRRPDVLNDRLEVVPGADVHTTYRVRECATLDDALAEHPDAAFICTPTSMHLAAAMAAARAGCHLFVEKPLSHTWDGVEELAALVDAKRLVACVGYQLRFHPCLQAVRGWLADDAIGRVVAMDAEVGESLPGWHPYEDYRQGYAARRDLGGGAILTQIHELDYVCWLVGPPRRVFAVGGHLSDLAIDVEDTASLLMDCGVAGRPLPVHVHLDYLQRPPSRTCKIVGEAGKIELDLGAASAKLSDGQGRATGSASFPALERNQLFLDELRHFLACVEGRTAPGVPLREAMQSLRVALAARASLESGEVVVL